MHAEQDYSYSYTYKIVRYLICRRNHSFVYLVYWTGGSARAARRQPWMADSNLSFVRLSGTAKRAVAPIVAARASTGRLVIPLFSNAGYLPFLRNLICSMIRIQLDAWVVIAWDNATCPGLLAPSIIGAPSATPFCVFPYAGSTGVVTTERGIARYRTVSFNRMVLQKPLWIEWLLQQGYEVIQTDLDTVWLHNPLPLLHRLRVRPVRPNSSLREHPITYLPSPSSPASSPVDMLPEVAFQSEHAHGFNSGVFYARPTPGARLLLRVWIERLTELLSSNNVFEEQWALNTALQRLRSANAGGAASNGTGEGASTLAYGLLQDAHFPNGKIWWSYPWLADKRAAYIVHANWVQRGKKSRLVRDNLWQLDDTDERCATEYRLIARGCHKLCHPVLWAEPGSRVRVLKSCASLNREDDRQVRRRALKWARNGTWGELRGTLWHPSAYHALGHGCVRNTSVMAHAATVHRLVFGPQ